MKFHITVRSWWLLLLSLMIAAGAVYFVIFDDWRHGADVSAEHAMYCLLFVATLIGGLFFGAAAKARKWGTVIGLLLVVCSGTFLLVAESAGRVAKVGFEATAVANKDASALKGAMADLERSRTALSDANAQFARECSGGLGPKCKGLKAAVDTLEMQFYKAQQRADTVKPAAPANGTAHYFAQAAQVFGFAVDPKRVEQGYMLLSPVARVFTLDICILVLLHLALGVELKSTVVEAPKGDGGGQKLLPSPRQEVLVEDPVVLALRKAKRPVTNDELADLMGVSKGHASKLVAAREGMLRKERAGRTVAISLAQVH